MGKNGQNEKFTSSVLLTLIDKGVLAIIIIFVGFYCNRMLEKYKLEMQQKFEMDSARAKADSDREIIRIKHEQEREIQGIRNQEERNLGILQSAFRYQGALAEHRLTAYQEIYTSGMELAEFMVPIVSGNISAEEKMNLIGLNNKFIAITMKNTMYLDRKSEIEFNDLKLDVLKPNHEMTSDEVVKIFNDDLFNKLSEFLGNLRKRIYHDLSPDAHLR